MCLALVTLTITIRMGSALVRRGTGAGSYGNLSNATLAGGISKLQISEFSKI